MNEKFTKKELNKIVKNINKMIIISIDDIQYPDEEFKQIHIKGDYIPYIASSYGRIISVNYKHRNGSCQTLQTWINKYGYESLCINYNNKSYGFEVHTIIAKLFIYNDDKEHKTQVNHIDGNKTYNCVWNLEWTTPKENINHAWENGLAHSYGENNGNNKYSIDDIKYVCELLELNYSFRKIEKITNVSYAMISLILRKKNWIEISGNYDFTNYSYGKKSNKKIIKTCELLENRELSISEISKKLNIKKNVIYDIMRGHSYKYISQYYDIDRRKNKQ
jgi:hypothetical protein